MDLSLICEIINIYDYLDCNILLYNTDTKTVFICSKIKTVCKIIRNSENWSNVVVDKLITEGSGLQLNGLFIFLLKNNNFKEIEFNFNQFLDNILLNFTKLKKLTLINYNKLLGDSLITLVQLEELNIGSYNQFINNSLINLTILKKLDLGSYNHILGNSLTTLLQLEELNLGSYNKPLIDSLLTLVKLKKLDLRNYNEHLFNSLTTLLQLEELNLKSYNKPLYYTYESRKTGHSYIGSRLDKLVKLKKLNLGSYNQPRISYNPSFGHDVFSSLVDLEELTIGSFNQYIDNALKSLTKLKLLNTGIYSIPLIIDIPRDSLWCFNC